MSDEVSPSRVVSPVRLGDDDQFEAGLRPRTLDAYIGQVRLRENLDVSITATRQRREALDHVLLYGPPGLGKTTLAYVIANELGVPIRTTAGPVLEKPGDLAAILTNLKEHEVLFIDEIHRMSPVIEEILYPAMEDYELDIVIGQGPGARSVKVPVQRFTLIGATTPGRATHSTAPRPVWHRTPPGLLPRCGHPGDRGAVGRDFRGADRRRRDRRDRAPLTRDTAGRQPPVAEGAGLRPGAGRRRYHPVGGPAGAGATRGGQQTGSTRRTGDCYAPLSISSGVDRSG